MMKSMRHIDEKLMARLARGEITGPEREQLMEHILHCDECRFRYVNIKVMQASRRKKFSIPEYVQTAAYILTGILIFVLMGIFSMRATSRTSEEKISAIYVNETRQVDSLKIPVINYIFIDTMALNIFYFRGDKEKFLYHFDLKENLIRIEARQDR